MPKEVCDETEADESEGEPSVVPEGREDGFEEPSVAPHARRLADLSVVHRAAQGVSDLDRRRGCRRSRFRWLLGRAVRGSVRAVHGLPPRAISRLGNSLHARSAAPRAELFLDVDVLG